MTLSFADLSHHQPSLNIVEYRKVRPVIALKATEGISFVDPRFAERWRAAAGMPRIAYHFARAKFNGAQEFHHFLDVVNGAGGFTSRDVIALDVEDPQTPGQALNNAQEFIGEAVKFGYTRGLIYTYPSYVREHDLFASRFPAGWRRLWYANYANVSDAAMAMPPGWDRTQLYARQYTDKAQVSGVGVCDDSRVIRAWWTETGPVTPSQPQEGADDMPSLDEIRDMVRSELRYAVDAITKGGSNSVYDVHDPTALEIVEANLTEKLQQTAPPVVGS